MVFLFPLQVQLLLLSLISRPLFFFGYYAILLFWIYRYPSSFSFLLLFFIFVDMILTKTSNKSVSRKTIVDMIKLEMKESNTGVIEFILESLYERCILLPNQTWRLLTLLYCVIVQASSFIASQLNATISWSPHLLFILFGNHIGSTFNQDKFIQFLLFAAIFLYYQVSLRFYHIIHSFTSDLMQCTS